MSDITAYGPKDIEIYKKCKKISVDFIDQLNSKNLLKTYITNEEEVLIDNIRMRLESTRMATEKFEELIVSDWNTMVKSLDLLGFSKVDIMSMYGGLLVHTILESFELFKKYLLWTIKPEPKIHYQLPLGTILKILREKGVDHNFDQCMDKEIRDAIAHGWYWWDNQNFVYNLDKTLKRTKEIHLGELFIKYRHIELLVKSFNDNAFERVVEIKNSSKNN